MLIKNKLLVQYLILVHRNFHKSILRRHIKSKLYRLSSKASINLKNNQNILRILKVIKQYFGNVLQFLTKI